MKIGYIGLGKMGKNMVLRLLEQGVEIVAWNRSPEPREEVKQAGALTTKTIEDLINSLDTPRIIWLMLPAGNVTDQFVDKLLPLLSAGDLLIDGANSFYKRSLKTEFSSKLSNADKALAKGVHFMDIGVSGGPSGARNGACLMVGGDKEDFKRIEPLLKLIAAPNAYGYMGEWGAGHFAKMVHNGIEYGMMEAIAEGLAVLKYSDFKLNLPEIFKVYNNKSVIESRLVGWTKEALMEDPELKEYSSKIGHTGEGEWTINTAKELGVEVPVLEDSFKVRVESEKLPDEDRNESKALSSLRFRNKAVSAMRGKFGGHSVKKN